MSLLPGGANYGQRQHAPEKVTGGYHVWCESGAADVLGSREFVAWLKKNPNMSYGINFANNASANIQPGHPLWSLMEEIAKEFKIKVFPLGLMTREYVEWTGAPDNTRRFDMIAISAR